MNQLIREAKILIIDDNEESVAVIEQMLRKTGYRALYSSTDSRQTMSLVANVAPDMLVLDLVMPPPDGLAILDQLALSTNQDKWLAILALTGDAPAGARIKALSMGARDFLSKPVDRIDLLTRTRSLLEWRYAHHEAEQERNRRLLAERIGNAIETESDVLDRLGTIEECLDAGRAAAGLRVADFSLRIGAELNLDEAVLARLHSAARLYDFGILALPESIRNSRAPLTAEERLKMTQHTLAARQMFGGSASTALEMAKDIAMSHHERWDGTGYPEGTKGTDTPLAARIVAVAQVYDALVTARPYRAAMPPEEALAEIQRQAGYTFDPDIVAAFLRAMQASQPAEADPALDEIETLG